MEEDEVKRVVPEKNRGGIWVTLGMEEYRIPPLGFGAIKELHSRLELLQNMTVAPSQEQMTAVVEIVHMAIARNYPSMTVESVTDMIDLGNFQEVLNAVLSTSGFKRAASGEARTTSQ